MFYAYAQTGTQRFREIFGLDFEDFKAGLVVYHHPGITVSQQDNKDEATETLNNAMLHYDAEYASKTEWKQCLGVSTLTLQKVLGSTWKTFYKKAGFKALHDIAMTHPVFGGDTLYAKTTVQNANDTQQKDVGEVELVTEAINQRDEVVSKLHYTLLIYKNGHYPQDKHLKDTLSPVGEDRFLAYHKNDAGELVEQSGLYFEDLVVGETYEHRPGKTFFEGENWQHATRALDWHPRYVDIEYMKHYHDGKMLVNDHYLFGVVTALSTRTFDRVVANLGWTNTLIHAPMFVGDTMYVASEITGKRESHSRPTQGILNAKTTAFNQHGKEVLSFERAFLIYKRGLGPYEEAGY